MSKSQSKELFKRKQRGRAKKDSITAETGISATGPNVNNAPTAKLYPLPTSHGSAAGLLGSGEDPAVVVINPLPPNSMNQTKEKRTKICCLL